MKNQTRFISRIFKQPVLALALGLTLASQASWAESILSEREVTLTVDISQTNIRRSRADYTMPVVKVLVPDLADVTILDHRNTGERAPCLATYDTRLPNDVIQDRPAIEELPFKITLKKDAYLTTGEDSSPVCAVYLLETIAGTIRGFQFVHERQLNVGTRHPDDCR